MQQALTAIFQEHSRAYRHRYSRQWQLLDVDVTGKPAGKQAEMSQKGYFSTAGIRYGRQLGRVIASHYQEIVVDELFTGGAQLGHALRPIVIEAEEVLGLDEKKRQRTILRFDASGGRLEDINWMLGRGYQIHGKDCSSSRAATWAATVEQWYADPIHAERQMGWAEPLTTPDYVRSLRWLVIRWRKKNGQWGYAKLLSSLAATEILKLLGEPAAILADAQQVAAAYAKFYDQRGGAIEIQIKEDKQGFGLNKRQKRRAAAQQMVILLNALAHNVLMWAREWLTEYAPKLANYGILRLVRDVMSVSGCVELHQKTSALKRIVLNRAAPLIPGLISGLHSLLAPEEVVLIMEYL